MTRPVAHAFAAFHRGLLGGASLLVPARQRGEWRREWTAEMWHVRKTRGSASKPAWRTEREVTAFCLGAVQDALCLRRQAWRDARPAAAIDGSAGQALLCLALALCACYALALALPQVRAARNPEQQTTRPGLILIQAAGLSDHSQATIPFDQYRTWSANRHRYFDGFAFYRIRRESVWTGPEAPQGWRIAHSSFNLFALLGLPIRYMSAEGGDGRTPVAILSDQLWRKKFGGDAEIVGSVLRVGKLQAKIVGVAPNRAWKLPGAPDAWLLEPDAEISSNGPGYLVAHLTSLGLAEMWAPRTHIIDYNRDDSEHDYLGISFDEQTPTPWDLYRFAVFLALLALPAITSVSLGEYSASPHRPTWPRKVLRWAYMGAKIALLLAMVYFAALDCAYWHASQHSSASEYAQLFISFSICLFGMRWALLDQRRRCPVCLRRVAHPAQVGLASRTFLAWNGTELMCTGGHTLLHVPGLPTSWFSSQQWLYLDASWEFLFAGTDALN